MSLIACKECGGQVSTGASVCPHCGYPVVLSVEQKVEEPAPVTVEETVQEPAAVTAPASDPEPAAVTAPASDPEPAAVPAPASDPEKPASDPEKPAPAAPAAPAKAEPCPESHLAKAIVFTCLFFMAFGIPGIVNGSKVRWAYNHNNMEGAKRYSRNAQKWCSLSLAFGIVKWVLIIVGIVLLSAL